MILDFDGMGIKGTPAHTRQIHCINFDRYRQVTQYDGVQYNADTQ